MSIDTGSFRRFAAITASTAIVAITTTIAVHPAAATAEPPSARPCFIVQPRWNTAIDGPPPSCPVPTWQRTTETRTEPQPAGSGTSNRMDFGDEYADPPRH